ncbi:hypothetical protein NDNC_0140 [Candidatus Nasuia deltocephalinicola]|uniref:Transcription elongation factor GreA n=1 Tax=Candidatus Nasuia deltocephalincola TaxID=1160784 RepID=A0A974WLR0_9PROT|nr:hypothetical protein CU086_00500 [Candidatus Nasuia deltocephalinicola]WKD87089.1 hypothetical protein QUR95_00715 [Candidatus Nasuia deltocephalinicola]BEH03848.1 hypothetical protein NDNC_0140 [Candidatus Nasuia deltocephalinicola]
MDFFTLKEINDINKKINNLKYLELPKIINELSKAKLLGDLSENSEYIYAKKKKNLIEKEIKILEEKISKAKIKNTKNENLKKIILKDLKSDKLLEYQVDLKNKSNEINYNILNIIKNKKIGDLVKLKRYNKEILFKIILK